MSGVWHTVIDNQQMHNLVRVEEVAPLIEFIKERVNAYADPDELPCPCPERHQSEKDWCWLCRGERLLETYQSILPHPDEWRDRAEVLDQLAELDQSLETDL